MKDELQKYIDRMRERGYSDEEIRQRMGQGDGPDDISEHQNSSDGFDAGPVAAGERREGTEKRKRNTRTPKGSLKMFPVAVAAALIFLLAGFGGVLYSGFWNPGWDPFHGGEESANEKEQTGGAMPGGSEHVYDPGRIAECHFVALSDLNSQLLEAYQPILDEKFKGSDAIALLSVVNLCIFENEDPFIYFGGIGEDKTLRSVFVIVDHANQRVNIKVGSYCQHDDEVAVPEISSREGGVVELNRSGDVVHFDCTTVEGERGFNMATFEFVR